MTAIDDLRTGFLNKYLHRTDDPGGGVLSRPWDDDECDRLLGDSILRLWPRVGIFTQGDVAANSTTDTYLVPSELGTKFRISRIDLVNSSGLTADKVTTFRVVGDGGSLLVRPLLASGSTLRVFGWVPFAADGSDLLDDLQEAVAHRAAARAYGDLAAELLNSERQQNLDSGRVVSYGDAVGLAAYHERLYQDAIVDHPNRLSYAPRAAHRR